MFKEKTAVSIDKMAKEELFLPVEMRKLEIEPGKLNKNVKTENPFLSMSPQRSLFTKQHMQNFKCTCNTRKKSTSNLTISKRKFKVLREPTLKILQNYNSDNNVRHGSKELFCKNIVQSCLLHVNSDNLNLGALVDNCNQLRISSEDSVKNRTIEHNSGSKWWKKNVSAIKQETELSQEKNCTGPTCSQQALNPPCDITIDELASYFETLVHIPKKMSSMAEMMYI